VLRMVQVEYIRWLYYQQHMSIRSIAKKVGSSRKTIRKVLALEDVRDYKYKKSIPRPRPVIGPVMKKNKKCWKMTRKTLQNRNILPGGSTKGSKRNMDFRAAKKVFAGRSG